MTKLKLIFLMLLTITLSYAKVDIIPNPVSVKENKGVFHLNAQTSIGSSVGIEDYGYYLAEVISTPIGADVHYTDNLDNATIKLTIDSLSCIAPESYRLTVKPDGINIYAQDRAGIFYGIQTLLQLFPPEIYSNKKFKNINWDIPCVEIIDSPNRPWRGMMFDVARYYFPISYLKHLIDMMGMYKYNKLQLHLTDDSGWRLESERYPLLTEKGAYAGTQGDRLGGYYTKDEIRDLIDYAAFRNIEIIPEIEFPAHILSAIVAYPELSCREEQLEVPRKNFISHDILCLGKDSSFKFLFDILDETTELFPSKYINIGGDEAVYERWEECENCQNLKKKLGLNETKELQGWLTDSVARRMKKLGRTVIGWEEIITRGDVSTPVVAMIWHEVADTSLVANTPHKAILAPASHIYLDFPENSTPGEVQAATWMPPRTVKDVYEMPVNDYSKSSQVLGVQGCLWSDQFIHGDKLQDMDLIGENRSKAYMDYLAFPRMIALSEVAWAKENNRSWPDFQQRLTHHYKKLENKGTGYRVPEPILVSKEVDSNGDKILILKPSVEGSQIRYTTDGSYPTRHSRLYNKEGIKVGVDTSVKASTLVNGERLSLPITIE